MTTFSDGGLTVAYREAGSGPAILFLHNGGTSSTIWRHQLAALSGHRRVIAVDLPGFGDSPRPASPARLSQMVELIAAFIDAEGLAPVLLVGNCMGTNIAVSLARRDPQTVSGVLAINPLTEASFSGGRIGLLHSMDRFIPAPTRVARSLSRRVRTPRAAGSASLRFQLGDKGVELGLHHDPELLACQVRSEQLPALVDVLDDMSSYGELDKQGTPLEVPVWILWGDQNRVLSRQRARHLDRVLHAARVEVLDGCGHLPMLEDPDRVTDLISSLADEIDQSLRTLAPEEPT